MPDVENSKDLISVLWSGADSTNNYEQAYRWAERKHKHGIVNVYLYTENQKI